jgi:hypothetical protein
MKFIIKAAAGASLFALAACGGHSDAGENIVANSENVADNLEEVADNLSNDTAADVTENKADAVRAAGENAADAADNAADNAADANKAADK